MRFRFGTFRCEILHAQEHVISVAGTWDGGWFRYRVGKAREVPAPPRRVASSSGTPDSIGTSTSGPASDDGTSAAPKRYDLDAPDGTPPASDLTVEVDALTIPGTFASGAVTFSDGTKAKWYLDQLGRLGLDDVPPGYRPSPGDAALFQSRLVEALRARGLA